jgi:CSLREA domain-containing protein
MSENVSVLAAGRGNPNINLSDGRNVLTQYAGPVELQQALIQDQAQPLSLASADFDEDGVPDLVSGYGFQQRGVVSLLRGNVDAIYPNAPEAQQRRATGAFSNAPFLSPAHLFQVATAVDFIGAGDFDGDSHWDLVTGTRGGAELYLLSGDGHGELSDPQRIVLPGMLTALVTGEINRADGLADVIVGVTTKDGARVLVFEGPNGALKAKPEELRMPGPVTALALGQLDDSYEMDLVVGAGDQLLIVHGRDRKLSLDQEQQERVEAVQIERRPVGDSIRSIAVGDFSGQHQADISVLTDAGEVDVLAAPLEQSGKQRRTPRLSAFRRQRLTSQSWPQATAIVRAKVSSLAADDLVVVSPEQMQLVLLSAAATKDASGATATLSSSRAPVAIFPMRLNVDALTDLVVLQEGQSAASVIPTAATQTFVVNSTADTNDGQCTATVNGCTLREAINAANSSPGSNISFNIPGPAPYTISPTSKLPSTSQSITIDGTTQPGFSGSPIIEVNGTNAGNTDGFRLDGNANTIRGLVINRFTRPAIADFGGNSGHIIEGNYIGINVAGTAASPNGEAGVQLDGGNGVIGGTVVAARNVISGNHGPAVFLPDPLDIGNVVKGNFIGTDATGHVVLGGFGIHISSNGAKNNTVGGTTAQARNIISTGRDPNLAETFGIDIGGSATGNLVQGNYLGTDVTGTVALGNGTGVSMNQSPNNTVGGTVSSARNIVSASQFAGVFLYQPLAINNLVQGNYIGTDVSGTQPLGNTTNGVGMGGCNHNTIGGVVAGAGNLISANLNGVHLYFAENVANHDNTVQGNLIGTDVTGAVALGNHLAGVDLQNADANLIGGNTAGARNVVSGNLDSGFAIYGGPTGGQGQGSANNNRIEGNFVGINAAGTAKLANVRDGIAITITQGSAANTIGGATTDKRNIISGNGRNGIAIGIRLIDPNTGQLLPGTGGTGITIQNNFIGTDVTGNTCLGNTQDGVFIDADSTTNTISDNLIACNGRNGAFIPQNSNPAVRIFLDDNLVYQNTALGIDLGVAGVTANDPLDADGGANLQQNFPTVTSFGPSLASGGNKAGTERFDLNGPETPVSTDAAFTVASQLPSAPNTTFTIHWYFSTDSQCVSNQQASRPLAFGRIPGITTDANGNANFSFAFDFPVGTSSGVINTTATDPNGNTSEFSPCLPVKAPPAVQFSAPGYSVNEAGVSATITVTRSGDDTVPASVDFATANGYAPSCAAVSGVAVQNCDYVVTSGTLNFAAGDTSKTFNVLVGDDAFVEGNETVSLTLSNTIGASLGAQSTATLTITDNDIAGSTPGARRFAALLDGGQETPANNSLAKGTGYVLLNGSETSAQVGLQFQNLGSSEISAHIHNGAPGVAGPILFTLAPPIVNPIVNMSISPNAQQVADLKAGLHYFNVHSNNFPNGEIRGQLRWNPTLEDAFFVRQQYLDFLSRDGDPGGFNFWVSLVSGCAADAQCLHDRTIIVSNAFFFEPEFQQTAGYVFRVYRAAYGNSQPFPNPDGSNATEANKLIDYSAFVADRARVVGGANLAAAQLVFANQFVLRSQFTSRYGAGLNTGALFVDAILANIQSADAVNLTAQRQILIDQYNNAGGGNAGRGQVLYRLADDNSQNPFNNQAFINAEYNRQFALTLYFGYLRRNPDIGGFLFWQSQINSAPLRNVDKQNALVCSFLTGAEYQFRFGPNAPRSNEECPH